jgi:hypothetical protein
MPLQDMGKQYSKPGSAAFRERDNYRIRQINHSLVFYRVLDSLPEFFRQHFQNPLARLVGDPLVDRIGQRHFQPQISDG